MIPQEFQQSPPRNIEYMGGIFDKNRKRSKAILLFSPILIPAVGLIFWLKFGDLVPGLLWGAGIAAFCELFGVALMMNAKKAVALCQNGLVVLGTVQEAKITGNTGRYTSENSAGYIFIDVAYKDDIGGHYQGKAGFIGSSLELDMKPGDEVPIIYDTKNSSSFLIYSPKLGVSAFGRAKKV